MELATLKYKLHRGQLRERQPDRVALQLARMLAHQGLRRLLLALEQHQRLLLAVGLENLRIHHRPVRRKVTRDVFHGDVRGKAGHVNHLRRRAAVTVVLRGVAVETVQRRRREVRSVGRRVDLGMLRKVHVHPFTEQSHALHAPNHTRHTQKTSSPKTCNQTERTRTHLQVVERQLRLETIPHLDQSVVGLVVKNLDPNDVSVVREQVEQLVRLDFLHIAPKVSITITGDLTP